MSSINDITVSNNTGNINVTAGNNNTATQINQIKELSLEYMEESFAEIVHNVHLINKKDPEGVQEMLEILIESTQKYMTE